MDERLRSLERGDDARWITEALRAGRLTRARVRAAAHLGHVGARAWFEAGPRRPRWSTKPLAPWTPGPETLTERVTAPGLDDGVRMDLVRAAAAEAALGRLELPLAEGVEVRSLPHGRRRVHVPRPGGCPFVHWLLAVALDEGRAQVEDLAGVAELVLSSRVVPLHERLPALELPDGVPLRGWTLKRRSRPPVVLAVTDAGTTILEAERALLLDRGWPAEAGDPDKARAARALAARDEPWAQRARADCLEGLGDPEEAERALTDALERAPADLELRLARAALLGRLGQPLASAADYREVAERAAGPAARADALGKQGHALLGADRPAAAREALEAAAALRPDSRTLLLLARARRLAGDPAGALLAANGALERAPGLAEARHEARLAARDLDR